MFDITPANTITKVSSRRGAEITSSRNDVPITPLASAIDVRVAVDDSRVEVEVVNDGVRSVPLAADPGARSGYGLPGLRERAAHVGGEFSAGHAEGGRWLVRASLPRTTAQREEDR